MKGSMTKKLILYFTVTLLVFAAVIGILFSVLFTSNMTQHNKADLEKRANRISQTLSGFLEGNSLSGEQEKGHSGKGQGQGGYGAFLKFMDDIAMGEVWLVDKDTNLITRGDHGTAVTYDTLPQGGDKLIQNALEGEVGYSESFSELVGQKSITVCVPSYSAKGEVLAAVLLHAPIEGMEESVESGLWILILSLLVALLLAVCMAVILSKKFIGPIKNMNKTAKQLAKGDYNQKTDIVQQDEIGELAQTMDELSERLLLAQTQRERLEKEKQDFYADISHELRTPITVIRGSLESMRDGKIKEAEKQQEYYTQMITETNHMQHMVNDLLDYSKLRNPDFVVETELLNLSDVLSDTLRGVRRIGERKHIKITYDNPFAIIKTVGNYEKLRQMFFIVLDNAVKFSVENGVVSVTVKQEKEGYVVQVHDDGAGMREEDIPHIFDRFYKESSKQNENGTGIGLAIAKQIADRHKIVISVSSQEGKGTDFYFTFKGPEMI